MNITLSGIFALSILIAGAIALVRSKDIQPSFYPFILLIWIGCTNEVLSAVLLSFKFHTIVNNNIYVLCESLTIAWFFKRVANIPSGRRIFILLVSSFIIFWIMENLVIGRITEISSYFRIYYSFVIVILSITTVNHLIVTAPKALLKMPLFLISMGFIVFFTYKILVEAFWLYGLNNSNDFRMDVYNILVYLNLFVNLLFALVVLWLPKKRESMLLF
jgi:hypothetical protein